MKWVPRVISLPLLKIIWIRPSPWGVKVTLDPGPTGTRLTRGLVNGRAGAEECYLSSTVTWSLWRCCRCVDGWEDDRSEEDQGSIKVVARLLWSTKKDYRQTRKSTHENQPSEVSDTQEHSRAQSSRLCLPSLHQLLRTRWECLCFGILRSSGKPPVTDKHFIGCELQRSNLATPY